MADDIEHSQRGINSTATCETEECKLSCISSCNSNNEACMSVNNNNNNCDNNCPPATTQQCINSKIAISHASSSEQNDSRQAALIAGLTTGLVVLALTAVTIVGFVVYRRRSIQKILLRRESTEEKEEEDKESFNSSYFLSQPMIPSQLLQQRQMVYLPPIKPEPMLISKEYYNVIDYNDPHSPFLIGAQSLQIPHLDDDNINTNNNYIRRSLNIISIPQTVRIPPSRSSSVKITKYDNLHNEEDDDEEIEKSTLKRAISITKSIKPTMVRINTVLKKDAEGITRKASVRTKLCEQQKSYPQNSISTNESGKLDFYLCPPSSSTTSIQSSIADGSITVFWDLPPPRSLNTTTSTTSINIVQ